MKSWFSVYYLLFICIFYIKVQCSGVLLYYNVHQRFEWTFYVHKHLSHLFFYKLDDEKKLFRGGGCEDISYIFVWDVMHFIVKKCWEIVNHIILMIENWDKVLSKPPLSHIIISRVTFIQLLLLLIFSDLCWLNRMVFGLSSIYTISTRHH